MKIENSTFFITGGCSGLGLATVEHLLSQGANVIAADLKTSNEDVTSLCSKYPSSRLKIQQLDVTNQKNVQNALQSAHDQFGQIGGVVNCAGILTAGLLKHKKPKYEMTGDKLMLTLKVNVLGSFFVAQEYAKMAIKNEYKNGVIVNVSSVAGEDGQRGQVAYSASKGAIMGMTLPMAREIGKYGLRVVAIMPGLFKTKMSHGMPPKVATTILKNSALGRFGTPEEFALFVEAVIRNGYLTGVNLRLDGGTKLPML
jgi:NAD(P)-dependent dehydrogenase (short-subunit alcohol dehydrogenase family)